LFKKRTNSILKISNALSKKLIVQLTSTLNLYAVELVTGSGVLSESENVSA